MVAAHRRAVWAALALSVTLTTAWAQTGHAHTRSGLMQDEISRGPGVHRVDGPNPHVRTAELSSLLPVGPPAAVLSTRDPADLTVAAALAAQSRGPLLTLPADGYSEPVEDELTRLRPVRVVVVGALPYIRDAILNATSPYPSSRSDLDVGLGEGPVQTAAAAARRFPTRTPVAYVISEFDPASAINAAVLIARRPGPVLIVRPNEVPIETASELTRLAPRQVVVVGGERVVSTAVALRLGRYAGSHGAVRVARVDSDPRETSAALAERHPRGVGEAYLVSLADPAGALAAAAVAARSGAPVLVTGYQLSDEVAAALTRLRPTAVFIVGSPDVIARETVERVAGTLADAAT